MWEFGLRYLFYYREDTVRIYMFNQWTIKVKNILKIRVFLPNNEYQSMTHMCFVRSILSLNFVTQFLQFSCNYRLGLDRSRLVIHDGGVSHWLLPLKGFLSGTKEGLKHPLHKYYYDINRNNNELYYDIMRIKSMIFNYIGTSRKVSIFSNYNIDCSSGTLNKNNKYNKKEYG